MKLYNFYHVTKDVFGDSYDIFIHTKSVSSNNGVSYTYKKVPPYISTSYFHVFSENSDFYKKLRPVASTRKQRKLWYLKCSTE